MQYDPESGKSVPPLTISHLAPLGQTIMADHREYHHPNGFKSFFRIRWFLKRDLVVCFGLIVTRIILISLGVLALPAYIKAEEVIEVGKFSAESEGQKVPPGWELKTLKAIPNKTSYSLIKEADTVVLRAESRASYAALVKRVRIDPRDYPVIRWRWKTTRTYDKGDATRKDGDDYSARLYVIFEFEPEELSPWERLQYEAARLLYGEYPPTAAINYIWANRTSTGSVIPNAYSDRSMMFVLESGSLRLNTWVKEQRNVYDDFIEAFQREPPDIIAVAIMNDSDNTGESSVSYFGDIELLKN
jgi:hypothetical protein